MHWELNATQPIALRGWDDDYVCFDCASSDTHQLTWLAAELLVRLQHGAASTDDLLRHFLAADPDFPVAALTADIEAALVRFRELGLVAGVTP